MRNRLIQKSMVLLLTAGLCAQPATLVRADDSAGSHKPGIFRVYAKENCFVYDGKKHKCGAEVEDMYGNTLEENEDYTIIYPDDIVSIGTHKATVRYLGDYAKNKEDKVKYNIEPGAAKVKKEKAGDHCAKIRWTKVKGAEYYKIVIRQKDGNKKIKVSTTSGTKMTIRGLETGTTYVAGVTAYAKDKASGKRTIGNYGAHISFKTKGEKVYTTPELKADFGSGKEVKLSWKTVKGTDRVELYRREKKTADSGGKYKLMKTVKADAASYTDQLESGRFYDYKLVCFKKEKTSYKSIAKSDEFSVVGGFQAPELEWNAHAQGEESPFVNVQMTGVREVNGKQPTHFELYKKKGKSGWKKVKTVKLDKDDWLDNYAGYSYMDKAIRGGTRYSYKARGVYQKQGKKEYSDFSNIESLYGPDSLENSKVKADMVSKKQTAADEMTIKITNQNKNRKYIQLLYSEDEAYRTVYYYGHYQSYCTLVSCSTDGKNYMTPKQMKKKKQIKLGKGESVYLRFKTEDSDKIGTMPSLYSRCYMIFDDCGMEKTFFSGTRVDLKKGAVCSYVEEG